jgi:hypothetical protein
MAALVRDDEAAASAERHRGAVGVTGVQVQADELGDVFGGGLAGDVRGGAFLDDPPAFEDDELVREDQRFQRVVGDQQAWSGEVGQVPFELGLDRKSVV